MSSSFLDNSEFSKPKFTIEHITPNKKEVSIQLYEDETIKDILIKLAVYSKQTITNEYIFGWMIDKHNKIVPLGFNYPEISIRDPYKDIKPDNNFIDDKGNRKLIKNESSIHTTLEDFMNDYEITKSTIYFTTLFDYIKFLKMDPKKETEYDPFLFNGTIKKYWPKITEPLNFFHFNNSRLVKLRSDKLTSENIINEIPLPIPL